MCVEMCVAMASATLGQTAETVLFEPLYRQSTKMLENGLHLFCHVLVCTR
jgi:hypothetical protein